MADDAQLFRRVLGNLYIAQNVRTSIPVMMRYFQIPGDCEYMPFCDDFGPMNLSSVYTFNRSLRAELELCSASNQNLVLRAEKGKRALSNAIFMLGAYMILEMEKTVANVIGIFSWVDPGLVEGFRDATFSPVDFELSISDCWRGLAEGVRLGWIRSIQSSNNFVNNNGNHFFDKFGFRRTPSGSKPASSRLNEVDLKLYEHYDNPLNGDLHEVVPGKVIAFAAPVDLADGQLWFDHHDRYRNFSPHYYAKVFSGLGVTDVVKLSYTAYATAPFVDKGITVHNLPFPDCSCPTEDIVNTFLRIVDGARGLVAVHCRAGLGRTGTLIARYLMRSHGFGARQAMGWLRIMRPGSVIGPQQHYLCAAEPSERQGKAGKCFPFGHSPANPAEGGLTPAGSGSRATRFLRLPGRRALAVVEKYSVGAAPSDNRGGACGVPWKAWLLSRLAAACRRGARTPPPAAIDSSMHPCPLATQVRRGMAERGAARARAQAGRSRESLEQEAQAACGVPPAPDGPSPSCLPMPSPPPPPAVDLKAG